MNRDEQKQIAKAFDLLAAVGAVDAARDHVLVAQASRLLLPLVSEPVPGPTEPERGTPPVPPRLWDENVLEAMAVYGGGFVKALRFAYLAADDDNRRRILEVWDPLYGKQYREQGKRLRDGDETLDMPVAKTGNCVTSCAE